MPRSTNFVRLCLSIVFASLLAACGGGGESSNQPPPGNGLILTVKINNVVVAPTGNTVTLNSGDTITVEANRTVAWASTTTGATITNNVVTVTSWSARIAKPSAAAALYFLAASAGGDQTQLTLSMTPGDVRNGEYKLFATDANEYTLRIDFDARTYSILSGGTTVTTGPFTGPVDGTYTFSVPGYSPARNNARFRTGDALIVGAHPLGGNEARTFVASNHFVTAAADLPQTNMWMFSSDNVTTETPPVNSRIMAVRLAANQITYCSVAVGAITTVGNCLPANLNNYPLTFNVDRSITWMDGTSPVNFHVVRSGGETFLIRAQSYANGTKRFQIALDDAKATTANGTYEGSISNGSYGSISVSGNNLTRTAFTSNNVPDNMAGVLQQISQAQPLMGIAGASDGNNYFTQATMVLGTQIAARGAQKAGQISIGLRR
jgi:hypothetical protein